MSNIGCVYQALIPEAVSPSQLTLFDGKSLSSLLGAYDIFGDISPTMKSIAFSASNNGQVQQIHTLAGPFACIQPH